MDETLVMTAEADEQAYLEVAALAKQLVPKVSIRSQLSRIASDACACRCVETLDDAQAIAFLS
jgi:hypothetical protein